MEHRIVKVVIEVPCGGTQGRAAIEAIKIAMDFNCNVDFNFNGKEYKVLFNDLISCVKPFDSNDL
ncbi:MAG TPA: hypothetical protein VMV77_12725 [Bacteroidales bacterium]|nr:hypothetical protein [Bacteroidales bacterium]